MPTFEVKTPVGVNQIVMKKQIREAVAEATKRGKLRPNSVDSITGKNSGNNLGPGTPIIHFEQWERDDIEVKLILKGGGCENMNAQYSLPVRAAAPRPRRPHARGRAQVHPARGVAGAGQGLRARRPRRLHRRRPHVRLRPRQGAAVPHARRRESRSAAGRARGRRSWATVNTLGVGTMGFGGKRSLIGCKIGALNRLPASFFVSVAYDCWAFRRLGVRARRARPARSRNGSTATPSVPTMPMIGPGRASSAPAARSRCSAPLDEATVRALKVGDVVLIDGRVYTGRDAVHHHLMKHEPPVDLRGAVLYHCGPVVVKRRTAAGGSRPPARRPASARSPTRPTSSAATACAP